MNGLSAGTFGRAMSSHAVPICVSIMSSSAPGLPPRGLGWRLADCSQLVTKPPLPPQTMPVFRDSIHVCVGDRRDGHFEMSMYWALSTFVASIWIYVVWSLIYLLCPCLYCQMSALFYLSCLVSADKVMLTYCWGTPNISCFGCFRIKASITKKWGKL